MTEAERAFYDNRRRDGANAACLARCRSRLSTISAQRARLANLTDEAHRLPKRGAGRGQGEKSLCSGEFAGFQRTEKAESLRSG